jgi:hypothetical protein
MPHRFTIGRDRSSDISIADDSVSRTHAEIWLEDNGTLMLADHGSSNGTELIRAGEESALIQAAVLPGDQIRFGAVTLAVKDLIDAIEAKSPGALTGSRPPQATPTQKAAPHPVTGPPPSPPPIPSQSQAPPPIAGQAPQQAQVQSPPPLPKPIAPPPPVPQVTPPISGGKPVPPPVPPAPPQRAAAPPPPLPTPNVAPPPPLERAAAPPPPLPPIPDSPQGLRPAPPPPPPPPIPDRPPALDPFPPQRPAAGPPASPIVRCECGAIKTQGQVCPACHR